MAVRSTHEDGKTEECVLRVVNKSNRRVKVVWVGFDGKEACYMELEPGHARPQQTYTTHVWRIRFADTDALVGEYAGPSALLEVQTEGSLAVSPWSAIAPPPRPEWGTYCKRGKVLGMEIWSYECVDSRAVRIAEHIVRRMLEASPSEVVDRLAGAGTCVAIIGRGQVTTDIPAHTHLRWSEGGRDTDSTTRGLGGTAESPTTSCGEENLLMEGDRFYPSENILVHEFGHAVMNIGLTAEDRAAIKQLYNKAYRSGLYDKEAYIMENEDEYWAEGTQIWFEATIRTDVTSGVNTREKLRLRDPGLAAFMTRVYGDGHWRYLHDSPRPFLYHQTRAEDQRPPATTDTTTTISKQDLSTPDPPDPNLSTETRVLPGDSSAAFISTSSTAAVAAASSTGNNSSSSAAPVTLSAPGVEEDMERARLAASWNDGGGGGGFGAQAGCLRGVSGMMMVMTGTRCCCCLPEARRGRGNVSIGSGGGRGCMAVPSGGSSGSCGGWSVCRVAPGLWSGVGWGSGGVSVGCGAILRSVLLWAVVRGPAHHTTIKMS